MMAVGVDLDMKCITCLRQHGLTDKFFSARVICTVLEKTTGEGTERMGVRLDIALIANSLRYRTILY